ncbi:MAG: VWA domain-containing protein, partial [Phycisphaerales bacterium]|nr:VWA domain-containing protein [Phycisphaerales bacterium]
MIDFSLTLAAMQDTELFGHQWRLANPQWLMLGWAAPIVAIAIVFFAHRSSSNQRLVVDEAMIDSTFGRPRRWNTWVHAVVAMVATLSITIAIAQPQSDPREIEVEARGRDVVFMVDVSRSMLAEDVAPNRLEKSKLWINDLVDNLGNDRVGLVAFAGSSTVLSPLTTDRLFFKLALEELAPESVLVGGTNIGDAIRRTMDLVFAEPLDNDSQNFRDILIISDGEDQERLPVEA